MMRNLFILAGGTQPSPRWLDAFPDADLLTWDVAVSAQARPEVLWLSSRSKGWHELLRVARQQFADTPCVVLTNFPDAREGMAAFGAGARGYCHGWAAPAQLQRVREVVKGGGFWLGTEVMSHLMGAINKVNEPIEELPGELSGREAEVAREVAVGRSNKEIAALLGITERTVKAHLGAIFAKLGVRDRLQLALRLTRKKNEPER
jgi:DNA-binding NarL/FixJ family response regulator